MMAIHDVASLLCTESRLPTLKEIEAANPHKNMRVREGIEAAKLLGCRITRINSNDLRVDHPILQNDPRTEGYFTIPAVPISMGRTDTSQALLAFLRKVMDAASSISVEEETPKRMVQEVVHTNGSAAPTPASQPARIAQLPPEPEAVDPTMRLREISEKIAEASDFYKEFAHMYHHSTCKSGVVLGACDHMTCKLLRSNCADLIEASKEVEGMKAAFAEMHRLIEALQKDSAEKAVRLAEVSRQRVEEIAKKIEAAPVVRGEKVFKNHTVDGRRVCLESLGEQVGENDEVGPRRRKLLSQWAAYMNNIKVVDWDRELDSAVGSRTYDAVQMLMERGGWSASWQDTFVNHDWWERTDSIVGLVRPGGTRAMVGHYGWGVFGKMVGRLKAAKPM